MEIFIIFISKEIEGQFQITYAKKGVFKEIIQIF